VIKLSSVKNFATFSYNRRLTVNHVFFFFHLALEISWLCLLYGPPLWSSGQSPWLQILRSRVRFRALPDFLRSSGSGTGSTKPRDDN
jgi:hypothetical protein